MRHAAGLAAVAIRSCVQVLRFTDRRLRTDAPTVVAALRAALA